ncbi:hypothetical protein OQA88_8217 [Cercophora sp. LCS_1]
MRSNTISTLLLGALYPIASLAGQGVVHDYSFVPDHILRVTYAEVSTGCEKRMSVVINGTIPGPAVHLLPGAVSWIRVYNDMAGQNLTMHWHGLTQRMAPFADGTPQASQWPIPPGHFFDYEIAIDPEDAGTYFYHSHVEMQAMTCSGPLIVDDCGSSPFHYDDERVLSFSDYYLQSDQQMMHDVMGAPFKWMGEVDGILLNGQGVATGKTAASGPPGGNNGFFGGRFGSPAGHALDKRLHARNFNQVQDSDVCSLPVIDVEPGKAYRFRYIGATGLSLITTGIEDHSNLTIVQIDGMEYNAPVTTDHIQIGPGQRFDVLLQTKTMEELAADGNRTTYYIQFETRDRPEPYRGYGVLRYNHQTEVPASPPQSVVDLPERVDDWLEYTFEPLFPAKSEFPSASEVTRRIIIDAELTEDNNTGRVVWQLAHLSWTEFSYQSPALVDIYQHGQDAIPSLDAATQNNGWGWDPKTMSFPAHVGEVLEIVFENVGSDLQNSGVVETHPFHAHGKHYYDIGSGTGKYDADENNAKLEQLNYKPVKRDTTMLYRYTERVSPGEVSGWRAWRIRITDPGVWMIHCHILGHMMMGMQTVWVVGDASDIISIPRHFASGYMTYGSSVYGNATHAPAVYQYFNDTNKCGPVGSQPQERLRI